MKKYLISVAILTCATFVYFGIQPKADITLDLLSQNIEVLAASEGGNGTDFTCDCGLIWGKGCRADNYGAKCATSGATNCSAYDNNCSN